MFDRCLYFNTTSLARTLEREWTLAFRPFGLTPSQAFMLRVVLDKPQSFQNELAREMAISKATASRSLDGLEKLKMIERRVSETDAREVQIYPTAQAETMKAKLNLASRDVTIRLKKLLGSGEFEDTVAKLKKIREQLG